MKRRVVILVLLAVVVAVSGAWASPPRVVPWLDQRPVKASAHPPLAPPCRGSALRAQLFLQGATGSLVGGVNLLTAGSAPCSLLGWPTVSFTGAAASTTPLQVKELPRSPAPLDVLADPPGSLRALAPGKSARRLAFQRMPGISTLSPSDAGYCPCKAGLSSTLAGHPL